MRKFWMIFILLFSITIAYSQKNCKYQLIGYKTIHSGGAAMVDENGKPQRNQTTTYNVFITNTTSTKPKIQSVWLNKQQYIFSIELVKKLPIIRNNNGKQDTLVKKTGLFVWELIIKEKSSLKGKVLPSIAEKNELVVVLPNNKLSKRSLTELVGTMYE
ncbi:MAG: hypothetical protein V9E96_15205 [Chitinophagaceae bacterium]|mgnify:FL=1|nr:hypothetical protein [Chitinophagaceae bacterium]MBP9740474.1 hypothetical protein [Chitinophagaceae bacterium]